MHKFVAVTLVALSLTACGSKDETPVVPTPPECPEGTVYQENLGDQVPNGAGCVPADAVVADPSAPVVEEAPVAVGTVPGEGVSLSADPATAQKAE